MNIQNLLNKAGVPEALHAEALRVFDEADRKSDGLLWQKWSIRLFEAGKLAKLITWSDERLIDVDSELLEKDVAPMINVTAHGDNMPWGPYGVPLPAQWLDKNPDSEEFKQAVAANYWCPGAHPRSDKSHKAQYRRNAGEGMAYVLGIPVNVSAGLDAVQVWRSADGSICVLRCGDAWQLKREKKLIGSFGLKTRIGYEIDNLWRDKDGAQLWYPIPGFELRAPLTWSVLPGKIKA